jgi:hypothetical protein
VGAVKPFVALVDLKLPDAPRGESLKLVAERFPGVPQVALTGYPELAPLAGAALVKPFDLQVLLGRVEELYRAQATP